MSDGFLRLQAAGFAHKEELACNVFEGTSRDALLHAIEANRQHGLPLTSSDKRKAIGTLLTQHAQWSDRRIAAFVRRQAFLRSVPPQLPRLRMVTTEFSLIGGLETEPAARSTRGPSQSAFGHVTSAMEAPILSPSWGGSSRRVWHCLWRPRSSRVRLACHRIALAAVGYPDHSQILGEL